MGKLMFEEVEEQIKRTVHLIAVKIRDIWSSFKSRHAAASCIWAARISTSAIVLSLLWLTLNVVISSTANAATNSSVDFLLTSSRNSEDFSSSKSATYSPAQPIITSDIAQYSITSQKESADNIAAMITDIRRIRRHNRIQGVFLLLNGSALIALIILRLYKMRQSLSTKHLAKSDVEQ